MFACIGALTLGPIVLLTNGDSTKGRTMILPKELKQLFDSSSSEQSKMIRKLQGPLDQRILFVTGHEEDPQSEFITHKIHKIGRAHV